MIAKPDVGFLAAALAEARQGLAEGGIPIGSVLVHEARILGRGHNRRVQAGSVVRHAEIDALERAGRLEPRIYRASTLYTTLSPCAMCSGAILLYGIPRVVIGTRSARVPIKRRCSPPSEARGSSCTKAPATRCTGKNRRGLRPT
jgi:tRNA(Arg) A34 adenosine deaminase TadA